MRASDAIPLNHPLDGDPEYCCSGGRHNYHFRPGAPRIPGHLIWCCCKSVLSTIEPEIPEVNGMPVQLGVTCDSPDCGGNFEGDFMVPEDSTRSLRLAVVLRWAEQHGWRVIWDQPVWDSRTYCPDCCRDGAEVQGEQ